MLKKISQIPFSDTPEQAKKLDAIIAECAGDESQLMHVMQVAQDIYGYLPFEVQKKIADGMNVPLEKVYGVATFYAQFALSPKGKYAISVCLGTACYVKGVNTRSACVWALHATSRVRKACSMSFAHSSASAQRNAPPTVSFRFPPAAASARAVLRRL